MEEDKLFIEGIEIQEMPKAIFNNDEEKSCYNCIYGELVAYDDGCGGETAFVCSKEREEFDLGIGCDEWEAE